MGRNMNYAKRTMIIGAGSAGQIFADGDSKCKYCPRQIIIVDIYENNAYEIQQ